MKLFWILVLFACSVLVNCEVPDGKRQTADDTPEPEVAKDAEKDAADLELAKTTATKFAADVMKVRTSEDIHDLTNWLSDSLVFQMCHLRLYKGHFIALMTRSLLDTEKHPTDWTLEAENAFTRGDEELSMVVKANGFIFEADDQLILDFKKQEDGSYKLTHGTVLTCRAE